MRAQQTPRPEADTRCWHVYALEMDRHQVDSRARFEEYAQDALDSLPSNLRARMSNVEIVVEDELEFENEELRQKWIASAGHARVWPPVEKTMTTTKDYPVVLYDEV